MATTAKPDTTTVERGLPSNVYAERMVLGSVLLNESAFITVASILKAEDFSLDKHRLIFVRMLELNQRDERIDRVTLANELIRHNELDTVDGLPYLSSLDEGLPELPNLESYARIVRDKSMLRQMIFTAQAAIHRCMLEEDEPHRILASTEDDFLRLGEAAAKDSLLSAAQVFDSAEGGINEFLDPARRVQGTSTGFLKFDEMTGGLRPGELIIIAARPAMGKTALALNMAMHVATNKRNPKAVAVFSLEMSKESLLTRLICSLARVDQQRFRSGFLNHEEHERLGMAAQDIYESQIYIDDTSATTLMDINAKLRKLRSQVKLGMVVVDYLQLMPTPNLGRNSNRVQEVGALSRGMKLLSKDLEVPFVVLSQLSRAPEQRIGDHRPQLADLRESGSIEQDADMVAFIFRPEVYQRDREDLRGVAELILAKQRNGPTGKIPLVFLHNYTKFENPVDAFDETPIE